MSALTTVELNHELVCLNRTVCIYILSNACIALACVSYVNSQSFSVGINRRAFNKVRTLSAFAAYVNGSILGKFIAAVALDNICLSIFRILVWITGQCRSKICNSRLGVRALAAIVKLNIARLNGYAVISQAANNFNSAQQVFRIIYIIAIGQLASQHIQYAIYLFIIFCIYFAAISYHVDSRILFCITDDNIAAGIIASGRAIIVMRIEYSSIATVIININICFIILENHAGISIAVAAAESVDMSNTIIFFILRSRKRRQLAQADAISQGKSLMVPDCIILQPQINLAGLFSTGIVNNAGPGGLRIRQADICLACTIKIRFAFTSVTHSQDIAIDNNGFISCCGCIGINIDGTAVVGNAIEGLSEILRSINIYIAVRGDGSSLKIIGIFCAPTSSYCFVIRISYQRTALYC